MRVCKVMLMGLALPVLAGCGGYNRADDGPPESEVAQTAIVTEHLEAPMRVEWLTSSWRVPGAAYPRGVNPIRVVCAQAPDPHAGGQLSSLFLYDFPGGGRRQLDGRRAGIGYIGYCLPSQLGHGVTEAEYVGSPRLSPDGRAVAFSAYPRPDGQAAADAGDVLSAWVVNIGTGTARRVGPHPHLFPSVKDPKDKTLTYEVEGWTRDGGSLVVMRNVYTWDTNFPVWFALDWPSGRRLSTEKADSAFRGFPDVCSDVPHRGVRSPDGKRTAFLVARQYDWVASKGPATVRIEDVGTRGVVRVLTLPLEYQTGTVLWTHDGTGLVVARTIGSGAATEVEVRWFRVRDGRMLHNARFPGRADVLRFSRSGRWLITLRGRYTPTAETIAKTQGIAGRRLGNVVDVVAWDWKAGRATVLPGSPAGAITAMDWVETPSAVH